jgi:hypothetical protein
LSRHHTCQLLHALPLYTIPKGGSQGLKIFIESR